MIIATGSRTELRRRGNLEGVPVPECRGEEPKSNLWRRTFSRGEPAQSAQHDPSR